jgi:hypothetical protein
MAHVRRLRSPEQDPGPLDPRTPDGLRAWTATARVLLGKLRPLAEDATQRSGARVHSRHHLRRNLIRVVRDVERHVDFLDGAPESGAAPEESAPGER